MAFLQISHKWSVLCYFFSSHHAVCVPLLLGLSRSHHWWVQYSHTKLCAYIIIIFIYGSQLTIGFWVGYLLSGHCRAEHFTLRAGPQKLENLNFVMKIQWFNLVKINISLQVLWSWYKRKIEIVWPMFSNSVIVSWKSL